MVDFNPHRDHARHETEETLANEDPYEADVRQPIADNGLLTRGPIREARCLRWVQSARNSRKALTSELPPITDMVRPRGNALRLPNAAEPLRAASDQIAFGFLENNRGCAIT